MEFAFSGLFSLFISSVFYLSDVGLLVCCTDADLTNISVGTEPSVYP